MDNTITLEQVVALAAQLSPQDRRVLAQQLLAEQTAPAHFSRNWASLQGIFPYPLCGEDAQGWVSRTRAEAEAQREHGLRGKR